MPCKPSPGEAGRRAAEAEKIDRLIRWLRNAAVTTFDFTYCGQQQVCKPKYLLTEDRDRIIRLLEAARPTADAAGTGPQITPANCPHCEHDRQFPGFESGGWMQLEWDGPIVACHVCNPDSKHPRTGE